jgi:hypothetical protein
MTCALLSSRARPIHIPGPAPRASESRRTRRVGVGSWSTNRAGGGACRAQSIGRVNGQTALDPGSPSTPILARPTPPPPSTPVAAPSCSLLIVDPDPAAREAVPAARKTSPLPGTAGATSAAPYIDIGSATEVMSFPQPHSLKPFPWNPAPLGSIA